MARAPHRILRGAERELVAYIVHADTCEGDRCGRRRRQSPCHAIAAGDAERPLWGDTVEKLAYPAAGHNISIQLAVSAIVYYVIGR